MIKFLVKGQNIETLEHEVIAADQIAFVKIHFVFDNSWKPLHKVVQFTRTSSLTTEFSDLTRQAVICRRNLQPVL